MSVPSQPYFYVASERGLERQVIAYLSRKYAGIVTAVEDVQKEDLDLVIYLLSCFELYPFVYFKPNHLVGLKGTFIKLSFLNCTDLIKVKKELMPKIRRNRERKSCRTDYSDMLAR